MTTSGAPPRPITRLAAVLAVAVLASAGCGSDTETAAEPQTTTTAAPTTTPTTTAALTTMTTTAAPTTTTTATTTTAAPATTTMAASATASAPADDADADDDTPADDADADDDTPAEDADADDAASAPTEVEQAAMDAWAVVFDSEADYADKVPHLENAAQLESTIAAYAETGASFGGVSLEPTAVAINGDVANVTYDVLFGSSAAYSDLSGEMQLVDGVWVVSRDTFCGFMSSARTPCQD